METRMKTIFQNWAKSTGDRNIKFVPSSFNFQLDTPPSSSSSSSSSPSSSSSSSSSFPFVSRCQYELPDGGRFHLVLSGNTSSSSNETASATALTAMVEDGLGLPDGFLMDINNFLFGDLMERPSHLKTLDNLVHLILRHASTLYDKLTADSITKSAAIEHNNTNNKINQRTTIPSSPFSSLNGSTNTPTLNRRSHQHLQHALQFRQQNPMYAHHSRQYTHPHRTASGAVPTSSSSLPPMRQNLASADASASMNRLTPTPSSSSASASVVRAASSSSAVATLSAPKLSLTPRGSISSAGSSSSSRPSSTNNNNNNNDNILVPPPARPGGIIDFDAQSKRKRTTFNYTDPLFHESRLATTTLMKQISILRSMDTRRDGFIAEPLDDNLYIWTVRLYFDDKDSCQIANDLHRLQTQDYVQMEFRFPSEYPSVPPIVRVVSPFIVGGHVAPHGGLCMELLTTSGWAPVNSIDAVCIQIRTMLLHGNARIDFNRLSFVRNYTFEGALNDMRNIVRIHRWDTADSRNSRRKILKS